MLTKKEATQEKANVGPALQCRGGASALWYQLVSAEAASRSATTIQVDAPFDGPVESVSFDPARGELVAKGYEDFHGGTWEGRAYFEAALRPP